LDSTGEESATLRSIKGPGNDNVRVKKSGIQQPWKSLVLIKSLSFHGMLPPKQSAVGESSVSLSRPHFDGGLIPGRLIAVTCAKIVGVTRLEAAASENDFAGSFLFRAVRFLLLPRPVLESVFGSKMRELEPSEAGKQGKSELRSCDARRMELPGRTLRLSRLWPYTEID
jgi:hypothetical protein